jgi:predicted GIY-YIG superfamily endonuclease
MQLYLIEAKDIFLYKIGITKNVKKRIKNLQTGCPNKLSVIHLYESENNVGKIEKALHKRFEHSKQKDIFNNLEGEWFDLPNEIIFDFKKICKEIEDNIIFLQESENPFV